MGEAEKHRNKSVKPAHINACVNIEYNSNRFHYCMGNCHMSFLIQHTYYDSHLKSNQHTDMPYAVYRALAVFTSTSHRPN
jgi:hypothetical protein